MRSSTLVMVNCLVCLFYEVRLKPVQENTLSQEDHLRIKPKFTRISRSIPQANAVKPAYTETESQTGQEEPVDPQSGGLSPFALTDNLSNLFRSSKSSKSSQKSSSKETHSDRPMNLAKETELVNNDNLRSDEQEECYKQQNIDPPRGPMNRKQFKLHDSKAVMPIMDIPQQYQSSFVRSSVLLDRGGKHYDDKNAEKVELTSLYSHPEKIAREKKVKHYPQPKTPELFRAVETVYKPTGIEVKFPIYDEDFDFHPDPLQGILDDKYWLDSQEQESIIQKYIDMAATNMMPPGMDFVKRSVFNSQKKVNSVNTKTGFKDCCATGRCPCNDIVACEECEKAKKKNAKKTNSSGNDDDCGISYKDNIHSKKIAPISSGKRKLLSFDYEDAEIPGEDCNEETQINDNLPDFALNNKEINIDYGDASKVKSEEKLNNIDTMRIGRKLLWLYEENEDDYVVTDDSEKENSRRNNLIFKDISSHNNDKGSDYQDTTLQPLHSILNIPENVHKLYKKHTKQKNCIDSLKTQSDRQVSNQFHTLEIDDQPGYYIPNKLANVLQKPLQSKLKTTLKTTTIDVDKEFEILKNDTFQNATTEQMTYDNQTETLNKTQNERRSIKGRRRNSEASDKHPNALPLFQAGEEPAAPGSKGQSQRNSTEQPAQPLLQSSVQPSSQTSINMLSDSSTGSITTDTLNITVEQKTTVDQNSSTTVKEVTQRIFSSHRKKNNEEDAIDVKVANDIVETVISESQRSSVLGHNLGLCRRNESLVNVKFGTIVPETSKVLQSVTDCILDRLKNHLAKQSCILLEPELLDFLKWLILSGESYKVYMQKLKYHEFPPDAVANYGNSCTLHKTTVPVCEPELQYNVPRSNITETFM